MVFRKDNKKHAESKKSKIPTITGSKKKNLPICLKTAKRLKESLKKPKLQKRLT